MNKIDFKKTCEMWDTTQLASVCHAKASRIKFLQEQIKSNYVLEDKRKIYRAELKRYKAELKIAQSVLQSRQLELF